MKADSVGSGGASWSPGKLACIAVGFGTAAAGLGISAWARPSPHGFIEAFVGLPLLLAGLFLTGLGIVLQGRPFGAAVRGVGWTLICLPIAAMLAVWLLM